MTTLRLKSLILIAALCGVDGACTDDTASDDAGTKQDAAGNTDSAGIQDAAGDDAAGDAGDGGPVDITDAEFTNRDPSCAAYVGQYQASVTDVGRTMNFTARVAITSNAGTCLLTSNGIPNHDFNAAGSFATPVAEVSETFTFPTSPTAAGTPTDLTLQFDNGVFLNGVKLDLLAAACYGVGPDPVGQERIGCMAEGTPWRYDPMFAGNTFGTDSNNAHTQPDGAYHYHGDPKAMYDTTGARASGVIGFAADGFPIYGPYIDDEGTIRRVVSGYTLKAGARVSQPGEGAFPGGNYDGTFVDDYEFTNAGDLDACNGMMRDGSYGYYVTNTYPWVLGCFIGTPDNSFRKGPPN